MEPTLPAARVVRQAGTPVAAPPVPVSERRWYAAGRTVLGAMVAFWPLTAIVLFAIATLLAFSSHAGP